MFHSRHIALLRPIGGKAFVIDQSALHNHDMFYSVLLSFLYLIGHVHPLNQPADLPAGREPWPVSPGATFTIVDRSLRWEVQLDSIDSIEEETQWMMATLAEWKGRTLQCITTGDLDIVRRVSFWATTPPKIGVHRQVIMELLFPDAFTQISDCIFLYNRLGFIDEDIVFKYGGADMEITCWNTEHPNPGETPLVDLRIEILVDEPLRLPPGQAD